MTGQWDYYDADDLVALGMQDPWDGPEPVLPDEPQPPRSPGLPDQCVSSITVGQVHYWCDRGRHDHGGLCGGSDPFGGNAEWRWWRS